MTVMPSKSVCVRVMMFTMNLKVRYEKEEEGERRRLTNQVQEEMGKILARKPSGMEDEE